MNGPSAVLTVGYVDVYGLCCFRLHNQSYPLILLVEIRKMGSIRVRTISITAPQQEHINSGRFLIHASALFVWVVDADLKSYFDTIPHAPLFDQVKQKVSDGKILTLVEKFLKQSILDGLDCWEPIEGLPQGAVLSPLLTCESISASSR